MSIMLKIRRWSLILAIISGVGTALSLGLHGLAAPSHGRGGDGDSMSVRQLTGPVVSEPILPVDTSGLPPAPSLAPMVAGEETVPNARLLPAMERTAGEAVTNDPVVQRQMGESQMPSPLQNWEGTAASSVGFIFPPDTDGQVGPNHYVQIVNASGQGAWVQVWDKSGGLLYSFGYNAMWPSSGSGSRCHTYGYGDPVVLYDQLADRWLLTQFTYPPSGPYNECVAVSKTGTPTNNPGDWWLYEFTVHNTKLNDYPKFAVWPDGYYMTANQFLNGLSWAGAGVWVFDRTAMLSGSATTYIYFDLYNLNSDYGGLLPSNLMGSNPPPVGAPNYLMSVDMDWNGPGTDDILHVFEVYTNWADPGSSTVTLANDLVVAPFDWNFANEGADVPQPGTSQGLDGLGDRLMMHLWYRNFGDHEALVVNHTVDVGSDQHGIRWYEIRGGNVDTTLADATIYQQGTYAPDGNHRWMGSLAMDQLGNMALGYSLSSNTVYPSIGYAGRLASDPLNTLPQSEAEIITGSGSQTGADPYGRGRWGDYSALSVDPLDDCTFWYTQEYIQTTGIRTWQSRVASFRFPNCAASATGTLSGTITDAGTLAPLSGATIHASNGLTVTLSTISKADGTYSLVLPVSTYTVTASDFGYTSGVASAVPVLSGTVTLQDFALVRAPESVVEGTVSDAVTGWPLYASLTVANVPLDPVWTDPQSGYYSLTVPTGFTYTFEVQAFVTGYQTETEQVGPVSGNTTHNFQLLADAVSCQAPGYVGGGLYENFELSFPPSSWQELDNAGNDVIWKSCSDWGEGNYTGGAGDCAGVSSDNAGPLEDDTELWSPVVDVANIATTTLQYRANYQHFISDTLDLDVSNNGGSNWTNVVRWHEDHGGFRAAPGELVSIDLAPYLSGSNNRLRWHYYNPNSGDWDWYAEIDEVRLGGSQCTPMPGGLVVGNVYDFKTGQALNSAMLETQSGSQATTYPTPDDPGLDDGFFTIFSPPGTQVLTASITGGYAPDVASLGVISGAAIYHDFYLTSGWLETNPASLATNVEFANQITLPLTLTNPGKMPVAYEMLEQDQGYQILGGAQFNLITIPETTYLLNDHTIQRYFHHQPYIRPEIQFEVPRITPASGYIDVLLLTPDDSVGGDISLISTTLQAYLDLHTVVWDGSAGDPTLGDLLPYEVVIVGNDYKWSSVGMITTTVGNSLADYLDAGGGVIDTLFVHDYYGWELAGRYIDQGYSPFTASTDDYTAVPYNLGTVYLPGHPVMQGVTSITDDPIIGLSHQDVGLAPGALRLADWNDGQVFVAVKGNVVGINQLWFHGANWSGDVPTLMHNAIRYLAFRDAGWLTTVPVSGTVPAMGTQVIQVSFNSADPSSGRSARYQANLVVDNNAPYGPYSIPVVMTVTVPYEYYFPYVGQDYVP
jgi:hypothetical protein